MVWHSFESGQKVSVDDVVRELENHINSGQGVSSPKEKHAYLEEIRQCGHDFIVYRPIGAGWGNSPLNPNCWFTIDGEPIHAYGLAPLGEPRTFPKLNTHKFLEQFEVFKAKVFAESGEHFVSFNTGLPYEWEYYKEIVYHEARQRLGFETWDKSDVGSGQILRAVIRAIEIEFPKRNNKDPIRNNLVRWQGRFGPSSLSHRSLLKGLENREQTSVYESLILELYQDDIVGESLFDRLIDRVGKQYDLIAYLLFLRNWSEFLPIAPTHFDRAFNMLAVDLVTTRRCSWENYNQYLGVIRQVRDALRDNGLDDARLIDAHSFCWMLQHPSLPSVSINRSAPLPEPLTNLKVGTFEDNTESSEHKPLDRKIDWSQIREYQAALGSYAEDVVLEAERRRLRQSGRADLADRVHSVSYEHTLGYDIESFDEDGTERQIEVKAARRSKGELSFFLTENERSKSHQLPNYFFYLVIDSKSKTEAVKYFPAGWLKPECLRPIVHSVRVLAY
jgi:hypothetical protein